MNFKGMVTLPVLAGLVLVGSLLQVKAEEFYKGKTVSVVIGSSSGGGIDAYGRLLARHLAKHIPGKPVVVAQNMPGASGMKSVQYVETIAAHDGTVIATFNPSLIGRSLTEPKRVALDFTKLRFVGSATAEVRACYVWHAVGPKTFEDVIAAKEIVFGATSPSASTYIESAILKNIFGARIKHVLGYPGSAELLIAIERGELHGDCVTWSTIPADWISSDKIVPFVRYSKATAHGMPLLPHILEKARNQEERQIINMVTIFSEIGRPFVAGSKVPEDRLAILREAFNKTIVDKDFLAEAAKSRRDVISPMTGEVVEKRIAELYATPKPVIGKVANAIK